jgi:hypothetical protein
MATRYHTGISIVRGRRPRDCRERRDPRAGSLRGHPFDPGHAVSRAPANRPICCWACRNRIFPSAASMILRTSEARCCPLCLPDHRSRGAVRLGADRRWLERRTCGSACSAGGGSCGCPRSIRRLEFRRRPAIGHRRLAPIGGGRRGADARMVTEIDQERRGGQSKD